MASFPDIQFVGEIQVSSPSLGLHRLRHLFSKWGVDLSATTIWFPACADDSTGNFCSLSDLDAKLEQMDIDSQDRICVSGARQGLSLAFDLDITENLLVVATAWPDVTKACRTDLFSWSCVDVASSFDMSKVAFDAEELCVDHHSFMNVVTTEDGLSTIKDFAEVASFLRNRIQVLAKERVR